MTTKESVMDNSQRSRVMVFVASVFLFLTVITMPPGHHGEFEWVSTINLKHREFCAALPRDLDYA